MRYEYCKEGAGDRRLANNLQYQQKKLTWNNADGQDVLIVQTPYEQSALDIMENICQFMNGTYQESNDYTRVVGLSDVWIKFTNQQERMPTGGCLIHQEACTYSVFSYHKENDVCRIFAPSLMGMVRPYTNVRTAIKLKAERQKITQKTGRRLFRNKKEESRPSGFYKIEISDVNLNAYHDGDMFYVINGITIPIVKKALEEKIFYIKTKDKPDFQSKNRAVQILVENVI